MQLTHYISPGKLPTSPLITRRHCCSCLPSSPERSAPTPQAALTERALELLALPDDQQPKLLLDLGCGSGLSGEALSDAGHIWVV